MKVKRAFRQTNRAFEMLSKSTEKCGKALGELESWQAQYKAFCEINGIEQRGEDK